MAVQRLSRLRLQGPGLNALHHRQCSGETDSSFRSAEFYFPSRLISESPLILVDCELTLSLYKPYLLIILILNDLYMAKELA